MPNIDVSKILSSGNDILGIEYIKAIRNLHSNIKPLTLQRSVNFKSASEIRTLIKEKDEKYCEYIPNNINILESPKDIFWGRKGCFCDFK